MIWLPACEIAPFEGGSERFVRRKYRLRAEATGTPERYMRRVPVRGGYRLEFALALLDPETQRAYKERAVSAYQAIEPVKREGPGESPQQPTTALARVPHGNAAIVASDAAQRLLPLESQSETLQLSTLPVEKQPLAHALYRVIELLLVNASGKADWERWRGPRRAGKFPEAQDVHGITIRAQGNFIKAMVADFKAAQPVLLDWNAIRSELVEATGDPGASLKLSDRTIERCLRRYKEQGLAGLQRQGRRDKGEIRFPHPAQAKFLTALYLGGDNTVRRTKLALERPRSAHDCLDILKLEISTGHLPGPPPSPGQVKRWIKEALPAVLRDYARLGPRRGLARRGPYIPWRLPPDIQVNHMWIADFRRVDVRAWINTDERLYRMFLGAIMDAASRDVVFLFDLYPSAQLFKSTLRLALTKWGVPKEIWLDNGKEFVCEEVAGGKLARTWNEPVLLDDEESRSVFHDLGCEPHWCLKANPDGKALLERFFQTFRRLELTMPGHTGRTAKERSERLEYEEREHLKFCREELPDTPLLRVDRLASELTRYVEAEYRHRKHTGYGMHGRTPAQVQAAFTGTRRFPRPEELDILLWHRKTLMVRGDKVSFQYNGRALLFRADELLALTGDCQVELHVDPLNCDRALAFAGQRVIVLEPVNPTGGRSTAEVKYEIHRQRSLEKSIKRAALAGSELAPVPSRSEYLGMLEAQADAKQTGLDAHRRDRRELISSPRYAAAVRALPGPAASEPELGQDEEPVFTSRTEAELWRKRKQNGKR